MRHTQLLIAAMAVSLVACRDKWDIKNYAENIAEVRCAKAFDCCTKAEIDASEQDAYRGDCEDNTADVLNFTEDLLEDGVDEGRLEYRGEVLERCLANYAALSCEDLKTGATSAAAECDQVFVPKVEVGATCVVNEECISANCYRADDEDDEGTCQAFAAQGESCNGATCASGTYCGGSTCVATKADGATCNNNFECTTGGCNGVDSETGSSGTCGLMGGEGTACFLTKGCAQIQPSVFATLGGLLLLWRKRRRGSTPVSA